MLIDFHTHIFSPRVKEDRGRYVDSDPCFALLYGDKKAKIATAADLIESMDKSGVDVSVILNIGWSTHQLCVETNDYILESIARYPKRLIGFCAVQPKAGKDAIDELERCAKGGIKGVGEMRPDTQGFDLTNAELMRPLVVTMIAHKLIFLTHSSEPVGHMYPGKGKVTPDTVYPLLANFPDLKVVCAHWGGGLPFYVLMPEVKQAMKNVYFDTAASPYLYSPQIYSQVSQLVGADKILFGSDFPLLSPTRLLKDINSVSLPDEARELILAGNARRLLGMRQKILKTEERELLLFCLSQHAPDLADKVKQLDIGLIDADTVNKMREAVGDELISKGLGEDDEPTKYGLQLDDLIGRLADLYIWPNSKKSD